MHKNPGHIISTVSWNTFFDKKEKASELQARLSSWSRNIMPKETVAIFDKICPPGEVWNIQSLELDLGIIDYNDLEADLNKKLSLVLHEKLLNLLHHTGTGNAERIEIFQENISRSRLLKAFLLYGVLPWNHRSADGSVNELLRFELQHNKGNIIALLRNIGTIHQQVRKRIAMQVNESNIRSIIRALEPAGSFHIIGFVNEMDAIQSKKNVIKAATGNFKKNLWFWVLNYLLTSHGSVFNRRSFVKSSLGQMAAHYNVGYEQVIGLIEQAVLITRNPSRAQNDLLHTLKVLSSENRRAKSPRNELKTTGHVDRWEKLRSYFLYSESKRSDLQVSEFNKLVQLLSKENKVRFRNMILPFAGSAIFWQQAINDLNERSIREIFFACDTSIATVLVESIQFLDNLIGKTDLVIGRNELWNMAACFLVTHKDAVFTGNIFFAHCLSKLEKKNKNIQKYIRNKLIRVDGPATAKTASAAQAYNMLTEALASKRQNDPGYYDIFFKDLLNSFIGAERSMLMNREILDSLQMMLLSNIRMHPAAAYNAFIQYRDKERLQWLLGFMNSSDLLKVMIQQIKNDQPRLVSFVESFLNELEASGEDLGFDASESFYRSVLNILLFEEQQIYRGGQNEAVLIESLFAELYRQMPVSDLYKFGLLIPVLLEKTAIVIPVLTGSIKEKIKRNYCFENWYSVWERINELTRSGKQYQPDITKLLSAFFNDKNFRDLRKADSKASSEILNYLLPDGIILRASMINEYVNILLTELSSYTRAGIEDLLNEIFWECLLKYSTHHGKPDLFRSAFNTLVVLLLPLSKIPHTDAGQKSIIVEHPVEKLSAPDIFLLIEQCLDACRSEIMFNEEEWHLDNLVYQALRLDPAGVKAIIVRTTVTPKRVNLLRTVIDFNLFTSCLTHDIDPAARKTVGKLEWLYDKLYELIPYIQAEKMRIGSWTGLWSLANSGLISTGHIEKILQDSLDEIKLATTNDEPGVLAVLKKQGITGKNPSRKKSLASKTVLQPRIIKGIPTGRILFMAKSGWIENLCHSMITQGRWLFLQHETHDLKNVSELLNGIVFYYPVEFLRALKKEFITAAQMTWLSVTLDFDVLVAAINKINSNKQQSLNILAKLYVALRKMNITGLSSKQMQRIIFKKLVNAWVRGSWINIAAENIWNELLWEIITIKGIAKEQLISDIKKYRDQLPASLRLSFDILDNSETGSAPSPQQAISKQVVKQALQKQGKQMITPGGIVVMNAGLVLVNSYISLFFERLGLTTTNKFVDEPARLEAVHHLQYVATGLTHTEEYLLALNKVLCGLPLSYPVSDGITIKDNEKQMVDGLIGTVIDFWPVIGKTSLDGFRGNWLVRNGLLNEREDKWELIIERRGYDVLLERCPFSFSVIKFPWMKKPLHVQW